MKLSKRLKMSADMITHGNRVADVGCDHAYCSIYLAEQGISPHCIAMDLRSGPLSKARENIEQAKLDGVVETRLSDGLSKLSEGEVDTVLISGMGGRLIVEILRNKPEAFHSLKEVVLQPQSEWREVREFILKEKFRITDENMCIEDGKYYLSIHAVNDRTECVGSEEKDSRIKMTEYTEAELRFGRSLVEKRHPVLLDYLDNELKKCKNIKERLATARTPGASERMEELEDEGTLIQGLLRGLAG